MDTPGHIALSRLSAMQRATDVISNNIANADTPGFRAARMVFADYVVQQRGIQTPSGGNSVAFVEDRATWRSAEAGPIARTGNPLDVAISGEGFFAVETPRGERFTRAGRFSVSTDGQLIDVEGNRVLSDQGRPIVLAPTDTQIEIKGDGTVQTENGPVARLRVVRFENQQFLTPEGDRLYRAETEAPRPVENISVVQGALEGSNVKPVLEITRLMAEMREFQFAAQFAERENERLQSAIDRILRRR